MGLGNGSAIDADAITRSVVILRNQLGKGVHEVKYRYTASLATGTGHRGKRE